MSGVRKDGWLKSRETWGAVVSVFGARERSPEDDAAVLQSWRNRQKLTVTLYTETPVIRQFNLVALFDTAVQSSLDECLSTSAAEETPAQPNQDTAHSS